MIELTKKHKTFSFTYYYRGIELTLLCVTTSRKKFGELAGLTVYEVNNSAYSFDLRYPICNENPDVLYATVGMGGEGTYIFKRDEIKTLEEFKTLINKHRETYSTYRDYLEKTGKS